MVLGLVVSLLTSQAVYEWVDGQGQAHFTNVAESIPEGARRRELKFDPPVPVSEAPARPPPAVSAPVERDGCERAQAQVDALEQQLAQLEESLQAEEARQAEACQQVLNTLGQGAWLRCQAGRALPPSESALPEQLDQAREVLRRAQAGGCR